ncbi:hypothetical protein Desdi_2538 [Desulfitobacterium dichloroeliminans LMG P-21439]|uniref:Uncharacterized protein n=1 Tax=Desulfitobacterium dichloroeliminans (strain LMG P-21439 / DCA1) TaxID=871963 RepID=L0F803_DESDL|nr:hypothetical protein [Desulfitobacterium dichloroeliminans]AGA69959.1 hypothetical protein Desdi_2538 [Desulfitobacterium dichloroeliminans LMG P-21439]
MKVYVVKSMDTNFVSSVDRIFISKQEAERYAVLQNEKYKFVTFLVSEYQVFNDVSQSSLAY